VFDDAKVGVFFKTTNCFWDKANTEMPKSAIVAVFQRQTFLKKCVCGRKNPVKTDLTGSTI